MSYTGNDLNQEWRDSRHGILDEQVSHHAPSPAAVEAHQRMRAEVARVGHIAIDTCPVCPELENALRVLTDEVLAGFNAAIARNHDQLPA